MALKFIENKLNMEKSEDWYRISMQQLKEMGLMSFLKPLGGLYKILTKYRPDTNWDEAMFAYYSNSKMTKEDAHEKVE